MRGPDRSDLGTGELGVDFKPSIRLTLEQDRFGTRPSGLLIIRVDLFFGPLVVTQRYQFVPYTSAVANKDIRPPY